MTKKMVDISKLTLTQIPVFCMLWGHVLSLLMFDMFFAMGTTMQWTLTTATALVLLLVPLHNQTTHELSDCALVQESYPRSLL